MQPHNARATASLVVSPSVKTFFDSSVSPLIENVLHRCGWLGRPPVARRHCHLDGPLGTGVHHQTRWRPVLPRTGHTHRPAGSARIVWSRAGQPWVDDADPANAPRPKNAHTASPWNDNTTPPASPENDSSSPNASPETTNHHSSDAVAQALPNPVWLRIRGNVAMVAKPGAASHTAGTALSTCIAVATFAERTCSEMLAGRVKLASEKKCVRMDGSPSIVNVQPSFGRGQWSGYSPPTVHSVSISISGSPTRRPTQFHRCPAVVPARSTWSKIWWSSRAATASTVAVTSSMPALRASARSHTCSVKIELLNARKSLVVGLICSTG